VLGLHAWTLLLLALYLYVRSLPPTPTAIPAADSAEAAWWGLWPITYLAPFWFWLGVTIVLALMAGCWKMVHADHPPHIHIPWRILPAPALLLCIAFSLWPIAHTRWGDAYILSQSIAWPDPALRLTHSWQAPLDVYLHSRVWLALGEALGWRDAVPVYRLLSPLAGALYLAALLDLARDEEFAPGWLTFGLGASLGLIQLFFGYVENYSFAAAGILLFLVLGRRVLYGRAPLWGAALVLGLTNATHPSTVVLAPSLLYLGWITWQQQRGTHSALRVVGEITLPVLACAAGTIWLMEAGGHGLVALVTTDRPGGGDASWLVPLWATRSRWEAYTLFSWLHLRDLLNGMLLVAPVVLPALVWIGLVGRTSAPRPAAAGRATLRFLALAALAHLTLIVLWNPDYGGQRDWDLFSLAWIATTLWCAGLARAKLDDWTLLTAMPPLLAVQILHTAAWIYQNTLPWSWP
jgi:hypothetical protein